MEGDDHREAYTTIVQGERLSPEKYKPTEAEVLDISRRQHVRHRYVRGADALSWSKTLSCTKGLRRNLGDLMSGRAIDDRTGPCREGEEPTPMTNGHEKSDFAIVALKPGNTAQAADLVEPRAKAEENANQHDTHRTLCRERVTQALERIRQAVHCFIVNDPRWEPHAGKPHVRICAGGAQ